MNEHSQRFHELKEAAEAAGELPSSDEELQELEHLWSSLDQVFASSRNAGPELNLENRIKNEMRTGIKRHTGISSRVFVLSGSLAAVITFVVMLFQIWTIRNAYREIQADLYQMQIKVILASLQSDSAADRLDGLFQVAKGKIQSRAVVDAVLRRLSADPSINIRLASVRALNPYANQPDVLADLNDAALREQSPLVLISILDLIRETDPVMAERILQKLIAEGQLATYLDPGTPDSFQPGTTNL